MGDVMLSFLFIYIFKDNVYTITIIGSNGKIHHVLAAASMQHGMSLSLIVFCGILQAGKNFFY